MPANTRGQRLLQITLLHRLLTVQNGCESLFHTMICFSFTIQGSIETFVQLNHSSLSVIGEFLRLIKLCIKPSTESVTGFSLIESSPYNSPIHQVIAAFNNPLFF